MGRALSVLGVSQRVLDLAAQHQRTTKLGDVKWRRDIITQAQDGAALVALSHYR